MATFEIVESEEQRMIRAVIDNETIRAEAGALHYMRGQIEMVSKMPSAGGFLKSVVTGETAFKPTYTGTGEIFFGPPTFGEYAILELNNEEWILDKGAYVCSDHSIEIGVYRNKAMNALFSGEGMFQISVKGTGKVVIYAPGKIQRFQLKGEKLSVDGSFAVARTSSLEFSVQRAAKSMLGSMTSGEGRLNAFMGSGTVLISPVPNRYESLVQRCRATPAASHQSRKGCGASIFILFAFGTAATGIGTLISSIL